MCPGSTCGPDSSFSQTAEFSNSLAAARSGAAEHIGVLLEAYRPYLLAIANRELPDALQGKAGGSDLVQETLLKGIRHFETFQGSTPDELAAWLRQILRHELANLVTAFGAAKRDLNREQSADSGIVDPHDTPPLEGLVRGELQRGLESAIASLPEHVRQLIELRHRDNLSFKEIAEALGKTEDATRRAWTRAVQLLQQELARNDSTSA